jgi:hypothetical protein
MMAGAAGRVEEDGEEEIDMAAVVVEEKVLDAFCGRDGSVTMWKTRLVWLAQCV